MRIFRLSQNFPPAERYSLTDQIRRSSRSVPANLAEAWAKRRYEAHFVSKLTDCQAEAMETQNWLIFVKECGYASEETVDSLLQDYDALLSSFQKMIAQSAEWVTK